LTLALRRLQLLALLLFGASATNALHLF
jgi:hypothetical protein